MEQWVEIRKSGNFKEIAGEHGISPIVARILVNRGLCDKKAIDEFLHPCANSLYEPVLLSGMDEAVAVVIDKILQKKSIRIIGDYDVDGICATYILWRGLTFFGAICDYSIPHRIEDGYGINQRLIDDAINAGMDTIITCDNGISAIVPVEYAKAHNITMIITDHHEVMFDNSNGKKEYILPQADVLIDPKLPNDTYPFKGICGAMVAYKFICALADKLGRKDTSEFINVNNELIGFAALATECDVMEIKDENRCLMVEGLRQLKNTGNLGMRALIDVNGLSGRELNSYHLGFVIGPCLNASGRLDTSLRAMELFTQQDESEAVKKACELKNLNEERKNMTVSETKRAIELINSKGTPDKVIVTYLEGCHESLAGIIAGKVRETFCHPTFVITDTRDGLKGSGRSIESYDMYENLVSVKDCLTKFGGHKSAAGLSLSKDKLDEFTKRINDNCTLEEKDFNETVRVDMELPFSYTSLKIAHEIELLEPFGNGNPKPLFALRNVTLISGRLMGASGRAARYKMSDGSGGVYELVYFGDIAKFTEFIEKTFSKKAADNLHTGNYVNVTIDIVYEMSVNVYKGNESLSLIMKYYR